MESNKHFISICFCFILFIYFYKFLSSLRPSAMVVNGGVESQIQHLFPLQWSIEVREKMMWRKEELKVFNHVEI